MKAFTRTQYGGPEVLQLEELDKPLIKDDQILVQVMANSVNPADWHILRGKPFFARFAFGLFKPKDRIPGADFAGIVVQTGTQVKAFKVGEKVFGESINGGAFAAYIAVPPDVCAPMPEGVAFSEMACAPIAGLTALQALLVHGNIKKGDTVLINGASGGVGHLTIQIAKAYGARVTAVCSSKNIEFVQRMGADQVIPYDSENIHAHKAKYDLVIDNHGNLRHKDFRRMGRRGVVVGFTSMGHMVRLLLENVFRSYPLAQFTAKANTSDLKVLGSLIQKGSIKVHIEKSFSFRDLPKAIAFIEDMRTRGKVAVLWDDVPVALEAEK
ncbi:NADPH:quinone reductase [Cyclobacterium lianum]|uniref:NADPH:quinone reductase n=1 Tax=Cyclobacterium lianum TaxID=388280 RepID=A0A1M7NU06_9BACT|nr:NAD(P)-dependent alcohol dehydrogenase [Cyclobacterium lianum]SHN07614.1 NADPH:quinone reductase [Cyclobacterium lianum]